MDWFFERVYRARAFDPRLGWWFSLGVMILHFALAYVTKDGGWISAGGAVVIVIGVITIARALIRVGDEKMMRSGRTVARLMRTDAEGKLVPARPEEERQQYQDAKAEFQHGPALVIVGTLINGYGSVLAVRFLCKGCLLG
jgi:hypothetical protein